MNEELVFNKISQFLLQEVKERNASCVVIGISGGIDSAVAAFVAAKSLGSKKSSRITNPRLFSYPQSRRQRWYRNIKTARY